MKKWLYIFTLALLATACTANFEEINTNFNQPERVTGDLLLPTVIFNLADLTVNQSFGLGDITAQYHGHYEFNDLDIYRWTSDGSYWGLYDLLQDVRDIKQYGITNELAGYEAVALILESYAYSLLTDAYGDVPYSQANQAETGVISPVYDSQEAVYEGMLAALDRANMLIDGDATIAGDILFAGDMTAWKKWANSLRVRLLMRISGVRDVSALLQGIVNDPITYPLFGSTGDDAVYHYSGSVPDLSPYSEGRGREYEYFLAMPTTHLIGLLEAHEDPRIHEWLGYKGGTTEYIGVEPGLNLGDIGRPTAYASKDTSYFYDPARISAIFMTYSELNFLLAEAAMKGMISGDAQAYYEAGVTASFAQWGVEMPADFLTSRVPYDAANADRLYEQKWLALYRTGTEAWFDWKRTGKPSFIQPGPGNVNNNQVPVRLMYPSLEQSVNATNYSAAAQRIGGDNINTRVWWDK
jgi:hypothetical protein